MNLLSQETSPYLLQHANNPVHWKAWNTNSLDEAKEKNSLIVISIGYSACHWCHVMEHESFEDQEVADVMNTNFVNIKVDREERPDVDAVYMKAIQLMTRRGGWPLNVVTLPDGRPIWGGTYFRKEEWIQTLGQLQEVYLSNPEKVIDYAEKLHEGIQLLSIIENKKSETTVNQEDLIPLVEKWKEDFDWEFGGMSRSPKFMMPNNYHFLLRFAFQKNDMKLFDFVNLTLTRMAYGGIFDTVDGGFSRYSVDNKWHVPHFEKMLYDNGQLISLYSDAFKLTKKPLYKEVIEKTISFVERELMNPEGGFYCALDADSLNPENHLEEGAFYVWKIPELKTIIGDDFDLFSQVFNINTFGLWEDGNYVLIQNKSLDEIAKNNNITLSTLQKKKLFWEQILYIKREKRSKPRLDDKCLTSWNAIMLKGFVDAYKALENENYLVLALKNANFIIKNLWSNEGNLFHNYKNEKSTINGYLEDYCFVISAFISLYEVTFDEKWLHYAKQLTDYSLEHFYDEKSGFFAFTSNLDEALITSHFETEDNVIPASNSVMGKNLFLLSIYFENSYYEKVSQRMLQNIMPNIQYPSAYSNWMDLTLNYSEQNKELAICGESALVYCSKINALYFPNVVLAGTKKVSTLSFLKDRFVADQTLFYLCQNRTCLTPTDDFQKIVSNLI
ncbi:thioredoxin domain-containing protein [Flavobacterium franklandianum]|uniref:Thioredoxin domain-containing protein n=1 Tax=Flavobacterium franklandianum TaxID=2594430 RepID=A0A553CQ86_9FLAO|nr:thioredoxin domain-containing protein [Flavobacterium franklandianum]TRX22710.1 thioredoxin domain-containing protein [Flavobacterium franklandianum]TRX26586.1 thioredoxin domain-containing protein [Flavobacterium franklandianum]